MERASAGTGQSGHEVDRDTGQLSLYDTIKPSLSGHTSVILTRSNLSLWINHAEIQDGISPIETCWLLNVPLYRFETERPRNTPHSECSCNPSFSVAAPGLVLLFITINSLIFTRTQLKLKCDLENNIRRHLPNSINDIAIQRFIHISNVILVILVITLT